MKSKLRTGKIAVSLIIIIMLLIGTAFVINNTFISNRLKIESVQKEFAAKISADGLFYIGFENNEQGEKIGKIETFIGGDYNLSIARIPRVIDNIKICRISEAAFENCESLSQIYIPGSITYIDDNAFNTGGNVDYFVESNSYSEKYCIKKQLKYNYYTADNDGSSEYSKIVNDKEYGDFYYSIFYYENEANCAITHFNSMSAQENVVIPGEIDGVTVTTVSSEAFLYCSNVENIVLPDGIKYIGNYAFAECTNLKRVTNLNKSVKLGKDVFNNSNNVKIK